MDKVPFSMLTEYLGAVPEFTALPSEILLQFYGLYKCATDAKTFATAQKTLPLTTWLKHVATRVFQPVQYKKWEACRRARNSVTSMAEAEQAYRDLVTGHHLLSSESVALLVEAAASATREDGTVAQQPKGWVGVSRFQMPAESTTQESTALFDAVRAHNVAEMERLIGPNVNALNEEGVALVHVAADAGNLAALRWLKSHGAKFDQRDADGQSVLWYAMTCEEWAILPFLIETLLEGGQSTELLRQFREQDLPLVENESIRQHLTSLMNT